VKEPPPPPPPPPPPKVQKQIVPVVEKQPPTIQKQVVEEQPDCKTVRVPKKVAYQVKTPCFYWERAVQLNTAIRGIVEYPFRYKRESVKLTTAGAAELRKVAASLKSFPLTDITVEAMTKRKTVGDPLILQKRVGVLIDFLKKEGVQNNFIAEGHVGAPKTAIDIYAGAGLKKPTKGCSTSSPLYETHHKTEYVNVQHCKQHKVKTQVVEQPPVVATPVVATQPECTTVRVPTKVARKVMSPCFYWERADQLNTELRGIAAYPFGNAQGSAELTGAGAVELRKVANDLKTFPLTDITVEATTKSDKVDESVVLQKRVRAIINFLKKEGVQNKFVSQGRIGAPKTAVEIYAAAGLKKPAAGCSTNGPLYETRYETEYVEEEHCQQQSQAQATVTPVAEPVRTVTPVAVPVRTQAVLQHADLLETTASICEEYREATSLDKSLSKMEFSYPFKLDSTALSAAGQTILSELATVLKAHPATEVTVLATTTAQGSAANALLQTRVATIEHFLTKEGVKNDMQSHGKVEDKVVSIKIFASFVPPAGFTPAKCDTDTALAPTPPPAPASAPTPSAPIPPAPTPTSTPPTRTSPTSQQHAAWVTARASTWKRVKTKQKYAPAQIGKSLHKAQEKWGKVKVSFDIAKRKALISEHEKIAKEIAMKTKPIPVDIVVDEQHWKTLTGKEIASKELQSKSASWSEACSKEKTVKAAAPVKEQVTEDGCPPGQIRKYFEKPIQDSHRQLTPCGYYMVSKRINERLRRVLETKIHYLPNRGQLTENGRSEVQRIAVVIKAHPQIPITLEGESSVEGEEAIRLVKSRVESTEAYLRELGVTNKFRSEGMVDAQSIATQIRVTGGIGVRPPGCKAGSPKYVEDENVVTKRDFVCVPAPMDSTAPAGSTSTFLGMQKEMYWKRELTSKQHSKETQFKKAAWTKSRWRQGMKMQGVMSTLAWVDTSEKETSVKENGWKAAANHAQTQTGKCFFNPKDCWASKASKKADHGEAHWKEMSWKRVYASMSEAGDEIAEQKAVAPVDHAEVDVKERTKKMEEKLIHHGELKGKTHVTAAEMQIKFSKQAEAKAATVYKPKPESKCHKCAEAFFEQGGCDILKTGGNPFTIMLTGCQECRGAAYARCDVTPPVKTVKVKKIVKVGADRDVYGCIHSAGYSWCKAKGRCIRAWQEDCPAAEEPQQVGQDVWAPVWAPEEVKEALQKQKVTKVHKKVRQESTDEVKAKKAFALKKAEQMAPSITEHKVEVYAPQQWLPEGWRPGHDTFEEHAHSQKRVLEDLLHKQRNEHTAEAWSIQQKPGAGAEKAVRTWEQRHELGAGAVKVVHVESRPGSQSSLSNELDSLNQELRADSRSSLKLMPDLPNPEDDDYDCEDNDAFIQLNMRHAVPTKVLNAEMGNKAQLKKQLGAEVPVSFLQLVDSCPTLKN